VAEAAGLPPGRALDLGCGQGGDAIWLAQRGWTVTGVDVSATALAVAAEQAAAAGVADAITWERADVGGSLPDGPFDLVTSSYLHSPVEIPWGAILRAAAAHPDLIVPSPTFTLVQTYETPHFSIVHADFYRLESPNDVWELGWDDARGEAVLLVEWAERLGPALTPRDRLEIEFETIGGADGNEDGARRAHLTGFGAWAERLARIGGLHERA